jgi:dUTP pyrophosphatase
MLLKFARIREVSAPTRGHPTDAGIDFYMPKITDELIPILNKGRTVVIGTHVNHTEDGKDKHYIVIKPGCNVPIPSGIKVEIPYGYMGLFLNKSGVASKKNLVIGAQVIDTFYSGEVHVDLHNIGTEEVRIYEEDKLAQMVLVPILGCDLLGVEENELYSWMKQNEFRDEGGFGSTDKK